MKKQPEPLRMGAKCNACALPAVYWDGAQREDEQGTQYVWCEAHSTAEDRKHPMYLPGVQPRLPGEAGG